MTTRREFLKVSAAGGLVFGFHLPAANAQNVAPEINAWVVVRPDDTVIIRYARSEMGQGSMTSAAQLVAEELECDWSKVQVEYADTNAQVRRKRAWGDMAAVGSRTIRQSRDYLRKAGAGAREMLIAAAARGWNAPVAECTASNGVITHGPSGRKTSFGKVAGEAAKLAPPKEVALKDPKNWKIAGKPIRRVDIPDIVTGRIRYGIDAQLPGMVYAAIAQCPVFGGKLKSVDAAKIEGRRGVIKVLPMEDYVAVVADNWWRAKEALKELPIEWSFGAGESASSESILQFLRAGLDDASNVVVARRDGELEQGLAGAAKVLEAEYFTPYLAHATLEPMGCTAVVKDGRVDRGRAAGKRVRAPGTARRRIRAPRRLAGLRSPGRADRQGDGKHAGEAAVDARGRHAARLLSPAQPGAHEGWPRCVGQSRSVVRARFGAVDHLDPAQAAAQGGRRSAGGGVVRRPAVR